MTAYRAMGRTVFLLFTLVSLTGRVVSWAVVLVLYALAIGVLGIHLRAVRDQPPGAELRACRRKTTMLVDVPPLDPAGFRRQS